MILAAIYPSDGGQYLVRRYCGRYQWIGPYTVDALGSAATFGEALENCKRLAGPDADVQVWAADERPEGT